MQDSKILITGGTGSLGTALIAYFLEKGHSPNNITIIARNELKLNQTQAKHPSVRCESGDVRDLDWLRTIFKGHEYVIHAGALKVIPSAEVRVKETLTSNVVGSMNVAIAAVDAGVKRVVGISTDKAVQAATIYGCSKYLMEGLFREADRWSDTSFNLVRYGNVLGSNQSVVPFLRTLIAQDKPLTITRLDMTRFWLSMLDAIKLVVDAATCEETGITIVPRAKASDMLTLAKAVAPDDNYPIIEIGKRPGEKVHEKLLHAGETHHSREAGYNFIIYHPAHLVLTPLPENFEYSSNTCEQYTVDELKQKIAES